MNKYIFIFIVGMLETILYTWFLIALQKKKTWLASFLMTTYMTVYLSLIAFAIQDASTFGLLFTYSLACGIGVFIRMKFENRKK